MISIDAITIATFIITAITLGFVFIYSFTKMILFFITISKNKKSKNEILKTSKKETIKLILDEIAKREQLIRNYGGNIDVIKKAIDEIFEYKKELANYDQAKK